MRLYFSVLALVVVAAAQAETVNPGFFPDGARGPQMHNVANRDPTAQQMRSAQWRIELAALRREAIEQQERDGGTLTNEHRASLQAKLDRINARWVASR